MFSFQRDTGEGAKNMDHLRSNSQGSFSSCLAVDLSSGSHVSMRLAKAMKSTFSLPSRNRVLFVKSKSPPGINSGCRNFPTNLLCYLAADTHRRWADVP